MDASQENDNDLDRIRKVVQELGEHFDTVQIFCTRLENTQGGTVTWQIGSGNWFARYGQVVQWSVKQDEIARNEGRSGD